MKVLNYELKPATVATLKHIAANSGISKEEVVRRILRPSRADGVTTHLDYWHAPKHRRLGLALMVTTHR